MLEARNITKIYRVADPKKRWGRGLLHALHDVSVRIPYERTLGVLGESGCGKTTLARILSLLLQPDSGEVIFEGRPTKSLTRKEIKDFRRKIQVIFQDPLNSLNPRMKIGDVLQEPFQIHPECLRGNIQKAAEELLEKVGLPTRMKGRYPHELSGGERQRVGIARAVALKPRIIVCDEPVSSLDVLVQAQVLNLLLRLQKEDSLAYVFISHDLRVVRHMSDTVIVMQNGRIVEEGPAGSIYESPSDPYTRKLLSGISLL